MSVALICPADAGSASAASGSHSIPSCSSSQSGWGPPCTASVQRMNTIKNKRNVSVALLNRLLLPDYAAASIQLMRTV